jgi:Skp family chaperone for outer membrane proteins
VKTLSLSGQAQARSASAVKKLIVSACVCAVLSGVTLWSTSAMAQDAAAAPAAAHRVALIDMAYVFKSYKKFDMLREDLKAEIQQSEEQAKSMAMEIQNLQKEMKNFQEGSKDFAEREQKLAQASAEFETFRRGAQRDFLKKESQIYHQVYMEVADTVAKYANYHKYTLVIRFNREELDTDNAQKLIEGMNRQVVFHRPEDDITIAVTDYLNKKFNGNARSGDAAAAPRTATGAKPAAKN